MGTVIHCLRPARDYSDGTVQTLLNGPAFFFFNVLKFRLFSQMILSVHFCRFKLEE